MTLTLTTGDLWDDATMRPIEQEPPVPKRISAMRAIRLKCATCMGGQMGQMPRGEVAQAVDECGSALCPLHPFRLGRDPWRPEPTEAQKAARQAQGLCLKSARNARERVEP